MNKLTAWPRRRRPVGGVFRANAGAFTLVLFASAVPTPLYGAYAAKFGFSAGLLTVIFAVYAVPLLVALLVFGDLSDAIGRKPVTLAALALLIVATGLFVAASDAVWLMAARAVQGLATGLLTASASGALLDTEPRDHPGLAPLVNAIGAMGGQASGALFSGVLVQYAPEPRRLVYVFLALAAIVLCAIFARQERETSRDVEAWRPHVRVRVPKLARASFLAGVPGLVASFALGSFYLSLGPDVALTVTDSSNVLVGALASFALLGTGAVTAVVLRAWPATTRTLLGCGLLVLGSSLTVVALALRDPLIFYAGTVVAGIGFGSAFFGTLERLSALAQPAERGAMSAAIYIVAYLSFAIPTLVAGVVSTSAGLLPTAIGFSVAVGALALVALLLTLRR